MKIEKKEKKNTGKQGLAAIPRTTMTTLTTVMMTTWIATIFDRATTTMFIMIITMAKRTAGMFLKSVLKLAPSGYQYLGTMS